MGPAPPGLQAEEGLDNLNDLVDATLAKAPWLESEQLCRVSDDAFDAVIAAITARTAACDQTVSIPAKHLEAATVEGWIALPRVLLAEVDCHSASTDGGGGGCGDQNATLPDASTGSQGSP